MYHFWDQWHYHPCVDGYIKVVLSSGSHDKILYTCFFFRIAALFLNVFSDVAVCWYKNSTVWIRHSTANIPWSDYKAGISQINRVCSAPAGHHLLLNFGWARIEWRVPWAATPTLGMGCVLTGGQNHLTSHQAAWRSGCHRGNAGAQFHKCHIALTSSHCPTTLGLTPASLQRSV